MQTQIFFIEMNDELGLLKLRDRLVVMSCDLVEGFY
jgi:hypothetical protein